MHYNLEEYPYPYPPIRKHASSSSFSSDMSPLWIELEHPRLFFECFKDKSEREDVMLIWFNHPISSYLNGIEEFCREQRWRCSEVDCVKGSEASVIILYDLDDFDYEYFTRAQTQLIIVTIVMGEKRYFLFF